MSCCGTTGCSVSERSLRILVTEAHELAGLGAVRSLGRAGHRVVASFPDGHRRPPSTYSRYCSGFCTQPDPWSRQFAFRDWWLGQARSGDFDVLLPTTEASAVVASALRDTTRTTLLMASPKSLEFALSKHQATRAALEAGVPAPRTLFFDESGSGRDSTRDLCALRYPVILKSDNHLQPDGIYAKGRAVRAETPEEAEPLLESLLALPTRVIVQEWAPGRGVGAFFLRYAGRVQLRFAHRRLHEIPATGGWSSLRESSTDLRLLEYGEKYCPLIIGGNTTPILDACLESGTRQVLCDFSADFDEFRSKCEAAKVAVRRNLSPILVQSGSPEEVGRAAETYLQEAEGMKGFILGTAVVPFGTPDENILAAREACLSPAV